MGNKSESEIDPPTVEEWRSLAPWQRWYIFGLVLLHTWETALYRFGLKMGGIKNV